MKEAVQSGTRPTEGQQRERRKKTVPPRNEFIARNSHGTHPAKNKEGGKAEVGRKRQM